MVVSCREMLENWELISVLALSWMPDGTLFPSNSALQYGIAWGALSAEIAHMWCYLRRLHVVLEWGTLPGTVTSVFASSQAGNPACGRKRVRYKHERWPKTFLVQ